MCFASSIVESHKKLFIASNSVSGIGSRKSTSRTDKPNSSNVVTINDPKNTNKMSRNKCRLQTEVCGDCGATDPSWASLNRGILLCADCASIHRSLGRHISIVKSLRQGTWEPSVLNFVNSLNAHGANSVWEHHLLDGTATTNSKNLIRLRKPTPKDPLNPNKSDFIKAKHVQLAFVLRPNLQDEDDVTSGTTNLEQELSKQLHASVRTSNLETSLRLLVQGGDPNFYHEEKKSTPLHVAAKFGQASQIELLIVYGADINAIDGNGLTPLEVAKANNHNLIAERLLYAMYEVTDRLIVYLGGKRPDHTTDNHLLIPQSKNNEISEQLKIARGRLQLMPNKIFEELVMDLYDEVDRRENEAISSTTCLNGENAVVPFLPANPFLSATRNQGRQKLARFSRTEFNNLLTDVLIDARRRENMASLRPLDVTASIVYSVQSSLNNSTTTNSALSTNATTTTTTITTVGTTKNANIDVTHDPNLSDDEPIYDPVADDDYELMPPIIQQAVVHQLSETQIENTNLEMETLRKQINEYVSEINQLKTVVQQLSNENCELKSKFLLSVSESVVANTSNNSIYDEPLRIDILMNDNERVHEEHHSLPTENVSISSTTQNVTGVAISSNSSSSTPSSSATSSSQSTIKRPASMYERRTILHPILTKTSSDCRNTSSMYQMTGDKSFTEEVNQRADIITHRLKELIHNMQHSGKSDNLVPCAELLKAAVIELINIFSSAPTSNKAIREPLVQLNRNIILIQHNCENLRNSLNNNDKVAIATSVKDVRECAYYIASATKALVLQLD